MGTYKRKYINLNTFKNSFSSKNKGVFGSVLLEQKDDKVTIKAKVSGLTLGNPHIINVVFYNKKDKKYIYIPLGSININNNQGEFKETFEDGKKENFHLLEAKAFFVDIQSLGKNKNMIFLAGSLDENYTFNGDVEKYEKLEKEEKKKTKVEDKNIKAIEENITSKVVKKQNKHIVEEKKKTKRDFQNNDVNEQKNSKEPIIKNENNGTSKEHTENTNNVNNKKEKRNSRTEDYYNILLSCLGNTNNEKESNKKNDTINIFEKLKEEVETLANLSAKDEESIVQDNRKQAIKYNEEHKQQSIENIFNTYPEANPFESQKIDVHWKVISLRDLGVLQKRYWNLFYEPIIVNAVEKYNEILLGQYFHESGDEKHLIAVRDEYNDNKKKSAINAGAIQFKSIIKNEKIVNGAIGYWIIKL